MHRLSFKFALAALACMPALAHAGTCEKPGKELSRAEAANVRTACAYAAATMLTWKDPAAGKSKLNAILADDFVVYTPTSDPSRFVEGNRDDYMQLVSATQREKYAEGNLQVLGTTAQGNRVATEMRAFFVGKDGVKTEDYYHQLFVFDAKGKIELCKQYTDTARVMRQNSEAGVRVAEAWLKALSTGSTEIAQSVLAEDFTWTVFRAEDPRRPMTKQMALKAIGGIPTVLKGLSITALPDGITAEGDRVSVQAASHGTHVNGKEYNNVYHFIMTLRDGRIQSIRQYSDIQYEAEVFSSAR